LNSSRGKLIKKNLQDQNGSPINQQKKEIKKIFDSESWRKKCGWTGEKKKYSDLTFSQNFEEKKLFQHFANLIKIRSKKNLQDQNGSPINQQKKEIQLWS
jgi:hypothetical protein